MDKLEDLIKETDALTYINSLKVTLQELKNEFSEIEEQVEYITQACERSRKLIRRADNQYRLIAKLAQKQEPTEVQLEEDDNMDEDLERLMTDVGRE